jgi:hypothetical protein
MIHRVPGPGIKADNFEWNFYKYGLRTREWSFYYHTTLVWFYLSLCLSYKRHLSTVSTSHRFEIVQYFEPPLQLFCLISLIAYVSHNGPRRIQHPGEPPNPNFIVSKPELSLRQLAMPENA